MSSVDAVGSLVVVVADVGGVIDVVLGGDEVAIGEDDVVLGEDGVGRAEVVDVETVGWFVELAALFEVAARSAQATTPNARSSSVVVLNTRRLNAPSILHIELSSA